MMEASQAKQTTPAAPRGPRLVLITADEPAKKESPSDVVGTGQNLTGSGGFCLTDR